MNNQKIKKRLFICFKCIRFITKIRKAVKLTKKHKMQHQIFKQLVQTEREYVKCLQSFIQQVKKPLIEQIISIQQGKRIFSNIDSILQLHQLIILPALEQTLQKYNPIKTKLSQLYLPCMPAFLIYMQYYNDYQIGDQLLRNLRNSKPKLHTYLLNLEMATSKYDHYIDDYRSRPIQRLGKYLLLFDAMIKIIGQDHCDYQNLKKARQQLHNLNKRIDFRGTQQERGQYALSLQFKYGTTLQPILDDPRRRYLQTHKCKLLGYKQEDIDLHIFSNMMLIINNYKDTKICSVKLQHSSVIQLFPQTKYFKNLVFVSGQNISLMLRFQSRLQLNRFLQSCRKIIIQLKQCYQERRNITMNDIRKSKSPQNAFYISRVKKGKCPFCQFVLIRVLYAQQQMDYQGIFRLFYCIQFQINQFRFRKKMIKTQIQAIFQKVNGFYNKRISMDFQTRMVGFYQSMKNGTCLTQFRRISLQTSFNNLFKDQKVQYQSQFLLNLLDIGDKYFNLAIYDLLSQSVTNALYKNRQQYINHIQQKGKKIFAPDLINYLYEKRGRLNHKALQQQSYGQLIRVNVFLNFLQIQQPITILIRQGASIRLLLQKLKEHLKLLYIQDFCLVIKERKNCFRRLDFDQAVFESANIVDQERPNLVGLSSLLRKSIYDLVIGQQKLPEIYLRKWLYLPPVVGQNQFFSTQSQYNDLQRERLIIGQLYYKLSKGQFYNMLNIQDLTRLVAYYIFIFHHDKIGGIELNFILNKIKLFNLQELDYLYVAFQLNTLIKRFQKNCKDLLKISYSQILKLFGDFSWIQYIGDMDDQQVVLTVSYNTLSLKGIKIDQILRYQQVRVSWSPRSIFIEEHNVLVRRVNLSHPYEVYQTIQYYKDMDSKKSLLSYNQNEKK